MTFTSVDLHLKGHIYNMQLEHFKGLIYEIAQDITDDARRTAADVKNHLLHAWHPYVEEVDEDGVDLALAKIGPFISDNDAQFVYKMMHVEPEILDRDRPERDRIVSILDSLIAPAMVTKTRPLGKFAFALARDDVPPEKNTQKEDDLEDALKRHFGHNRDMTPKETNAFKLLLKQKKYKDLIREPDVDVVFRGVRFDHKHLEKLTGETLEQEGVLRKPYTVTHYVKKSASSWTTSYDIAHEYAADGHNCTAVVFHARVSDNPNKFMVCDDALYKLVFTSSYRREHEAIALGPVRVSETEWWQV